MSPGYFSIISSLLPSKPSQTAQLTALLKTNGFKRGAARSFSVIFGGLSKEWKERRREERKRRGSWKSVKINRLNQPTPKKEFQQQLQNENTPVRFQNQGERGILQYFTHLNFQIEKIRGWFPIYKLYMAYTMMVISHIFHDDMMVIRPYINHDLWVITIIYGPFILLVTPLDVSLGRGACFHPHQGYPRGATLEETALKISELLCPKPMGYRGMNRYSVYI